MKVFFLITVIFGFLYFTVYVKVGRSAPRFSIPAKIFSLPRQIEWHLQYKVFSKKISGSWKSDDGMELLVTVTPDQKCKIISKDLPDWNYTGLWALPGSSPDNWIPQCGIDLTSNTFLHLSIHEGRLLGFTYDSYNGQKRSRKISFSRINNETSEERE